MKHVKGPDFPTGAIIVGRSGIRDAYRTGRGRVVMRARAHIEELRGGKSAIIVTELPYGVKKGGDGGVIKKIADLVNDKVLTEISDLADHSDRTGMRIQIELKRDAIPQVALNKLFKHTALQSTFGVNAVALVNGVPRTLSLLELLTHYLDFQREIVIAPVEGRAAQEGAARAHPAGLPDRARQPRRGDHADPRRRRHRRRADRPDERVRAVRAAGDRDPRAPPARADRARAQGRRGRVQRHPGAHRRAARAPRRRGEDRRADQGRAARAEGDLRPERRPPHRDRRRRGGARARGPDRGRGHGDRDHALRLHQAATRHRVPRAAARRHRRDGDGPEGRGLHRAPLRRLDARLHPVLHERRQGLPAEGARAAARLAPVEGPRDRQPAAVPPGREGARRHPDARLRGGEVPRLRDEEGRRQEDRARGVQHEPEGGRDHRDQDARRRRADRRSPLDRRGRRADGVAQRPGDPLQREGRARRWAATRRACRACACAATTR